MAYFADLFRLSSHRERAMMTLGALLALVTGFGIPLNTLMLGYAVNTFVLSGTNHTNWKTIDLEVETGRFVYLGLWVATAILTTGYGAVALWSWNAALLGSKIRKKYFRSLLSQSVGWYEVNKKEEMFYRFQTDIPTLLNGCGERVPITVQWFVTWLLSLVLAFKLSWKLSVSILFFSPIVVAVSGCITKRVYNMALNEYQTYVTAGMSAERALRRLHSVQAFNANEWECNRYAGYLQHSITLEIRKAMVSGVGMFFPWLFNIFTFAVAFGYGNYLVEHEGLFPGNVFPVFFGIVFASASIQQIFMNMDAITGAKLALKPILEIFEQQSPINFFSTAGKKIEEGLKGSIDFLGVFFRYPTRLNVKVLNSFDMKIQAGETVSLLGDPSSGVLAIPHLIERFYDVNKGQILLDGNEIRNYNVRWLRTQLGFVTKKPSFFPVTISDNIRHGLPDVTQAAIEDAAKAANIHAFIMSLPLGYSTVVSGDTAENIGLASGIRSSSRRHVGLIGESSFMSLNSHATTRVEWAPRDMPTTRSKRHSILSDKPLYHDKNASASSVGSGKSDDRQIQILVTDDSSVPGGQRRKTTLTSLTSEDSDSDTESSLTSQTSDLGKPANDLRSPSFGGKGTSRGSRDASSRYISGDHNLWGFGYWTDEAVVFTLGQKIQLDIARALVTSPAILLMEDGNNHFDHDTKDAIWRNLNSRRQTTVFVTHTPSHTVYTDRVIVVARGQKVDDRTPKQLREKKISTVFNKLSTAEKIKSLKGLAVFGLGVNKKNLGVLATKFATLAEDLYIRYKQDESESQHLKEYHSKENHAKVSVDKEHQVKLHPLARLLRLQKVDSFYLCLGLLLSVLMGLIPIGNAFVTGHFVTRWYDMAHGIENEHMLEVYDFLYIMLVVSLCACILRIVLNYCFSFAATSLTSRVRTMMFEAMLRQNMSFFDKEENRPAVLAHSLTHDPDLLHGMLGIRTGALLESLTTVIFGMTLALVAEWHTALIIATFGPLTLLGSFLQGKVHLKAEKVHSMHMEEASEIFQEALDNITNVTVLNMKQMYLDRLDTILQNDCNSAVKYAHLHGLGHGFLNIIIFVYTAIFFFASYLVRVEHGDFRCFFMAFSYLVFGTAEVDVSQIRNTLIHFHRAKHAAEKIFTLIDSRPSMNDGGTGGRILRPIHGKIAFRDVNFSYPCNPHCRVLRDFHLLVKPKKMLALVGPLGSGKSTVLKLLQRFYAVNSGTVKIDDTPLFNLDLDWWREQVCALIDDPEITSGRVKDNITYGDLREHISMAEITEAAKIADIHSRIQCLPEGYETILDGNGSVYFNRAERTRLAIARAAFKDPCVLLVDNIAASLEPKDAKEVLDTLWKFCEGRTTIVATNQLAEIPHADRILVLSHGTVIEAGTHEELMNIKGCYAMILSKQVNLEKLRAAQQRMRRMPKKRVHVINKTINEGRRLLSSRGMALAYAKGKNKLKMYP